MGVGEGLRRVFAACALAAAFAVVGVVGYTVVSGVREPSPAALDAVAHPAGSAVFPSLPQPDPQKDAPAPSSANPALALEDSLVPVIPSPPSSAATARRAGARASALVFGLTAATPRTATGEGAPLVAPPAPPATAAAPAMEAQAPAPPAAAPAREKGKAGYVRYGNKSRRELMIRARGSVLNATGGAAAKPVSAGESRATTFEGSPAEAAAKLETADKLDAVGRGLQSSPAAAEIGAEAIATLQEAAKELRGGSPAKPTTK